MQQVRDTLIPVNDFLYKLIPFVILIIAGCLIGVIIFKIYGIIEGKKIDKKTSGTTNKWFSWDEFYDWKKNKK